MRPSNVGPCPENDATDEIFASVDAPTEITFFAVDGAATVFCPLLPLFPAEYMAIKSRLFQMNLSGLRLSQLYWPPAFSETQLVD